MAREERAVSTMQSQQVTWHGRALEAPTASKQQPGSFAQRRPVGVEVGFAAVVLAALGFSLVLAYAAMSALTTRNGYAEMTITREIENLRAQNAVLQYQLHVASSKESVQEAASRLGLRLADPLHEVDYVILPRDMPKEDAIMLGKDLSRETGGVRAALAELAAEVVTSTDARAEASTVEGHRH
jgi:hypothetical protein